MCKVCSIDIVTSFATKMFRKLLLVFNFALVASNDVSAPLTYRKDYMFSQKLNLFYKEHTVPLSWSDALITCNAEGASLLTPSSRLEVEELLKIFSNGTYKIWLGIHDQFAEGVFVTLNGVPINRVYINWWWSGEPDDGFNSNIKGEDCVTLNRDGFYQDNDCYRKFKFFCQRPNFNITWNKKCDTYDHEYFHVAEIGKCYKFHKTPSSWHNAFRICSAEESTLWILKNNDQTRILMNNKDIAKNLNHEFHIGLSEILIEGVDLTINGEQVDELFYNNWVPNTETKHCRSTLSNGNFNKINCNHKAVFFCEKLI